ncbi:hypothetical protein ACFFWD_35510 [Bradyrhizobium erythrophlei]|uniref:hypothetical protein n=1 Tax=Bradyrhizobium erythrophlei TaxID=1437360 RepID=UPI0035F02379
MNIHDNPQTEGGLVEEAVHVEVEIEDRVEILALQPDGEVELVEIIRERLAIGEDFHFFERGRDESFRHHDRGRKHVRLVAHRCHQVTLEVGFEQHSKPHHFKPSTTMFKALQWAVSKHGYDLDPTNAAKANLILPGADAPLPREDVLGKYVKPGQCTLVVDLTLKDFSNG